jgi:hypothetical protein
MSMAMSLRHALCTAIAAGALAVGSCATIAAPAFAQVHRGPDVVEDTTCVDVNYVYSSKTNNSNVEVLGDMCSAPVKVRADEACEVGGFATTYYGPAVITGTSTENCTSPDVTATAWGWQYYKNGQWLTGHSGANT